MSTSIITTAAWGTEMGRRFTPPTVEEVAEYVREKGYHFEPMDFVAHYTSNGWKVGKALAPMVCWKSACWTFESNWRERHPNWQKRQGDTFRVVDYTKAPEHIRRYHKRFLEDEASLTNGEFSELFNWKP